MTLEPLFRDRVRKRLETPITAHAKAMIGGELTDRASLRFRKVSDHPVWTQHLLRNRCAKVGSCQALRIEPVQTVIPANRRRLANERVLALDPSAPVRRSPPVLKTDVAPYCVKSRDTIDAFIIQACYRALI